VFKLFRGWTDANSLHRQAIACGEAILTIRHDTPNVGNHSVAMALNIGVADASRRAADLD
jgi:hypothetical protein